MILDSRDSPLRKAKISTHIRRDPNFDVKLPSRVLQEKLNIVFPVQFEHEDDPLDVLGSCQLPDVQAKFVRRKIVFCIYTELFKGGEVLISPEI